MKRSLIYTPLAMLLVCFPVLMVSCQNEAETSSVVEVLHASENVSPQNGATTTSVSDQSEWPAFHGADRQNKSDETGLMKSWPDGGPELVWTISGLGEGYSSVSIAEGRIYTSGVKNDQTYVFAYDLDGNLVWQMPNGPAWEVEIPWARGYDGPRSTPTYNNGVVYHLSEISNLTAYQAATGEVMWSRNLMDDFDADMPDYGYSESVLIEGNRLFVRAAGQKGFQVCLNKLTGETIWTNTDIDGLYGYNSAITTEFGGYHQLIGASSTCYYSIDTETGELLWKVDFGNRHEVNCSDAVAVNEYVLISSSAGAGSILLKLTTSGDNITAEKVWQTDLMDNYHGGIIFHDGYFYGAGDENRGWFAIELSTGNQMWRETRRMGSLTYADGMLYLFEENGTMKLVTASPNEFKQTGEFNVPRGGEGPYWAHPVVCGGRLYLRHADKLYAYDIRS